MLRAFFRILTIALIFGLMVIFLLSGDEPVVPTDNMSDTPGTIREVQGDVRDVTPDDFVQTPSSEGTVLERLPAKEPPPVPPRPPKPVVWKRPIVYAAGKLKSDEVEIQLTGIEPVPIDEQCFGESAETWPCGRIAKTAFANFIRTRSINCDPSSQKDKKVITRCRVGKIDLGKWLVGNGWARSSDTMYAEEQELAKSKQQGIWSETRP